MTRARITVNAVPGSDDDVPINALVQLGNDGNGGELTYLWSLDDRPPGSAAVLSSTTIVNPTMTPDVEGSYRISLVVNDALPDMQVDAQVVAVRQVKNPALRVPAAREKTEVDASDGWATANDVFLRYIDGVLADGNLICGVNGTGGSLARGDVLRVTGTSTIKSGLPGQEKVPTFAKALATSPGDVDETLFVMEEKAGGGGTATAGQLLRARAVGQFLTVTGAAVSGDPVYVSDAGVLALTPGTNSRAVGHVTRAGGGDYDVFFDGSARIMSAAAPADAAYLTQGSFAGLSAEVDVTALSARLDVRRPEGANASTVVDVAGLRRDTSGTGASGIGAGLLFQARSASLEDVARVAGVANSIVANAVSQSSVALSARTGGGALAEVARFRGDGRLGMGAGFIASPATIPSTIYVDHDSGDTTPHVVLYNSSIGGNDVVLNMSHASWGAAPANGVRLRLDTSNWYLQSMNAIPINFIINGATAWVMTVSGSDRNLVAGSTSNRAVQTGLGSVGTPSISSSGDPDTGLVWDISSVANRLSVSLAGTERFRFDNTGTGELIPPADDQGSIGSATNRWNLVRASTITSGDVAFDDAACSACARPFEVGEDVALRVVRVELDDAARRVSYTVPVHLSCAPAVTVVAEVLE